MDSKYREDEMNNWLASVDKTNKFSTKQYNQSFFTKVYIKYGESEFIIDIPEFKIIKSSGNDIKYSSQNFRISTVLPMYQDKLTSRDNGMLFRDTMQVQCDNVSFYISRSNNKQIRSEVSIQNGDYIKWLWFCSNSTNTKTCKVKKINNTKFIEFKKLHF